MQNPDEMFREFPNGSNLESLGLIWPLLFRGLRRGNGAFRVE